MEEFFEEIQDLVTIKEKHQNSAGKPVSQDFFIYICMSELHSIRTLGAEYENLVSYPIDKQQLDNSSDEENKSSQDLNAELIKLITWYSDTYPELSKEQVLDYEVCSKVVSKCALMVDDLQKLVLQITKQQICPANTVEKPEDKELWDTIEAQLIEKFPHFSSHFLAYMKWTSSKPEEKNLQLSDLPPVGRYYQILKNQKTATQPSSTRAASRPTSTFEKKSEEAPSSETHQESKLATKGQRRGEAQNKGAATPLSDKARQEKEKLALLEVEKAILTLKKHPSMKQFPLKPQNSFIRRLQHRKVSSLGFTSESTGEDKKRCILITRP